MATKQIRKQTIKETSTSWTALFPSDTTTILGSQVFIKQITALLFSCITHIRGIFPEYAFDTRIFDDRNVKILNGNYECKNAYLMTRWLKSAFQALELEYMQTLTLEILTVNNQPLEFYAVDYKYSEVGPSCTFYANKEKNNAIHFSKSDIENATKKLVFALLDATEGLGELPIKFQLQLRIHYYDERTPASYTPDYFMDAEPCDWDKIQNLKRIKLGVVTTNHHSVSLSSGSTLVPSDGSDQPLFNYAVENTEQDLKEYNQDNDFNNARLQSWCNESSRIIQKPLERFDEELVKPDDSEEFEFIPPSTRQSPQESYHSSFMEGGQSPIDCTNNSNNYCAIGQLPIDLCNSTISVNSNDDEVIYVGKKQQQIAEIIRSLEADDDIKIGCICSLPEQKDVFKCSNCGFGHHKICYKLRPEATEEDNTFCYSCSKEKNFICLDENVVQCTEKQAMNLMLFRQLLYKLQYLKKISSTKVANDYNLTEGQAKKFIKKLSNEGFIKPSLSKDIYIIHSKKLKQYIDQYFRY